MKLQLGRKTEVKSVTNTVVTLNKKIKFTSSPNPDTHHTLPKGAVALMEFGNNEYGRVYKSKHGSMIFETIDKIDYDTERNFKIKK